MAEGDQDLPSEPYVKYADDLKNPDEYVRVSVLIKGLKKGSLARPRNALPANGSLNFENTKRTLCLKVDLTQQGITERWEYRVKELPEDVHTDRRKTYWKIKKDGEVILMLCKEKPGSWVKYLSSSGPGLDLSNG